MTKILIVDDDRELTDLLRFALERADLVPLIAHDTPGALATFEREKPDLVVLDVNLVPWSGLDLLQELRRASTRIPIVMLTALDGEDDKVKALELGADDYVTKPFSHRELIARVRAHVRRGDAETGETAPEQTSYTVGPVTLDTAQHAVLLDGERVSLTVTEFRLLHALIRRAGTVVGNRELLKRVWGYDDASTDVVRVTMHRLRRKLRDDAEEPRLLHTVSGVGVMLKPV